ncbi:hypothetical protein R3P38DRAFT_1885840 [Favolaschia claudopus]|uniref:Uncharacterized protein n=1 Tax=Favolaschia claudopus TaxID=2862362 RepID=A0AAW0DCK2_9AGAR
MHRIACSTCPCTNVDSETSTAAPRLTTSPRLHLSSPQTRIKDHVVPDASESGPLSLSSECTCVVDPYRIAPSSPCWEARDRGFEMLDSQDWNALRWPNVGSRVWSDCHSERRHEHRLRADCSRRDVNGRSRSGGGHPSRTLGQQSHCIQRNEYSMNSSPSTASTSPAPPPPGIETCSDTVPIADVERMMRMRPGPETGNYEGRKRLGWVRVVRLE